VTAVRWPPRRAVVLAATVVAVLAVLAGAAWLVGGVVAALGVVLGAVTGLGAALADVGWGWRTALAAATALVAWLGILASGSPVLAGLVVAGSALGQVPFTERGAKIAMFLPVIPAMTSSIALPGAAWAVSGWLAAGVLAIALVAAALHASGAAQRTPRDEAVRHALATAVVAGAGLGAAQALEVGHGYWLVVAVAAVLAVSRDATGREAAARVAGTLTGTLAAVLLVAVLPLWASLAVAAVLLVLSLAWALAEEVRLGAAAAAAAVVLLGSGGLVGAGADLALERLLLTAVGAGAAAATVALLWRLDRTDRASTTA
jgi:hypothetical protein